MQQLPSAVAAKAAMRRPRYQHACSLSPTNSTFQEMTLMVSEASFLTKSAMPSLAFALVSLPAAS